MKNLLLAGVTLVLAAWAPASGADQPVRGQLLVVSDPLAGTNPERRHIKILARGTGTIVGNPLADGCTLRVVANGGTSTSQTFVIPPGAFQGPNGPGWTQLSKRHRTSYRYADERGEHGPVTGILMRQVGRRLTILATIDGRGEGTQIDVVPPNPGTDGGMDLSIGGGDRYCVGFGGSARGKVTDDDAILFRISHPRTPTCPTFPGSSPSAAFVD